MIALSPNTFFVLTLMLTSVVSSFAQNIVVHTSDLKQTIDMIGGDMERSSKAIQNAKNKEDIIKWSFEDIDFNVCRVQYDKNQELVEGTKNWDFYKKQVATMQAIKAVNPDVKFFATMRSDYDGYGDDNNLPDWIVDYDTKDMDREKYGIFLADYCEYMSQQGVPISIISIVKEWTSFCSAWDSRDVTIKLNSELDARGIVKPKVSEQGFWAISHGIGFIEKVATLGTQDLYDSFCSHNYASEDPEKWVEIVELAATLGKVVYDDETSTGSGSPTYGVERPIYKQIGEYIKKAERYEAGLSGEVFFEIWSRGIDKETRSIYFPSGGSGERLRGYYLMKHFSNNILDSRYVTASLNDLDKVYSIQFRKGNKMVLWVINKSTDSYPLVPITVDAFKIDGEIDVHYWTDSTTIEGETNTLKPVGNLFEVRLPGESISCYRFNVKDEAQNLALNGKASQSSDNAGVPASKAIDGNTDGALSAASVAQTQDENQPWWQVELEEQDTIGLIQIYNCTDDSFKDALTNFTVTVWDTNNTLVYSKTIDEAAITLFSIDTEGVIGKTIKIQLNSSAILSLAEVKVMEGCLKVKQDQFIEFQLLDTMAYSTEAFLPGATLSSGLGVEYSSSETGIATIVDGMIQLQGVGTTNITASCDATQSYNAAVPVVQSLTVVKAEQQITFPALESRKVGDPSFLPGATASSGLTISYSSSKPEYAKIEDGRIIILAEGVTTITAAQSGNDKYTAAASIEQTLTIESGPDVVNPDIMTLLPVEDSYIRGDEYGDIIYGNENELVVKNTDNAEFHRKSFLKFDVYDVDQVYKAVLRLYATSVGASEIHAYSTSDDWNEATLNYNNAPSESSISYGSLAVTNETQYYEWDLTEYVKSEMEGDNILSIAMVDASDNKKTICFSSKEASENQPQLVIYKTETASINTPKADAIITLSLTPNPADEFIYLTSETEIKRIQIKSISGQILKETETDMQKEFSLDIRDFTNGIYLLSVCDKNNNYNTLKVLIK